MSLASGTSALVAQLTLLMEARDKGRLGEDEYQVLFNRLCSGPGGAEHEVTPGPVSSADTTPDEPPSKASRGVCHDFREDE